MKKLLLTITFSLFIGALALFSNSCTNNQKAKEDQKTTEIKCCNKQKDNNEVQAVYFHGTRRCATCQAVEKVTKETLEKFYEKKVAFISINREEAENKELVDKYKVSGQTLLIIKGDKIINLTNDAFLNARSNPSKLEKKLKSTIESML